MSASGAMPALILSRVAPSSSPDDNDAMAEGLINDGQWVHGREGLADGLGGDRRRGEGEQWRRRIGRLLGEELKEEDNASTTVSSGRSG
jgi:hypothetical protein